MKRARDILPVPAPIDTTAVLKNYLHFSELIKTDLRIGNLHGNSKTLAR